MRVIAFSDVHWLSKKLQVELYEYDPLLDYAPFLELCELLLADPPDVVVNLGDFAALYESSENSLPEVYQNVRDTMKVIKIRGNYDDKADGVDRVEIDGVRYEHGHKLAGGNPESRREYIQLLRENAKGLRIVHGHTHQPYWGAPWPLDVGSVTFSGTYGEIIDGGNAR